MMMNLKALGKTMAGIIVLVASILYTAAVYLILNSLNVRGSLVSLVPNLVGAAVLTEVVFNRYFPDEETFPKKKIWVPLTIGISILVALMLLALWASSAHTAGQ